METTDVGVTGATGGITVVTTCLASQVTTTMGMGAAQKKIEFISVHATELGGSQATMKIYENQTWLLNQTTISVHVGGSYARFEQQNVGLTNEKHEHIEITKYGP